MGVVYVTEYKVGAAARRRLVSSLRVRAPLADAALLRLANFAAGTVLLVLLLRLGVALVGVVVLTPA